MGGRDGGGGMGGGMGGGQTTAKGSGDRPDLMEKQVITG